MDQLRILLVENDGELRSALRLGLQLGGYLVAEAHDGLTALEILRVEPPDLVLLDLRIPNVGSVAILAESRCGWRLPKPKTVVLSEREDMSLAIEALMLGASDFLEKPVTAQDVRACVESVMRGVSPDGLDGEIERDDVLEAIRAALQEGRFGTVEPVLLGPDALTDVACLNLAGIVKEAHGRVDLAAKYYQQAVLTDPSYRPAGENLRRICEVRDCGVTRQPVFRATGPGVGQRGAIGDRGLSTHRVEK
jgi:CheY-like chemotaxis protein